MCHCPECDFLWVEDTDLHFFVVSCVKTLFREVRKHFAQSILDYLFFVGTYGDIM